MTPLEFLQKPCHVLFIIARLRMEKHGMLCSVGNHGRSHRGKLLTRTIWHRWLRSNYACNDRFTTMMLAHCVVLEKTPQGWLELTTRELPVGLCSPLHLIVNTLYPSGVHGGTTTICRDVWQVGISPSGPNFEYPLIAARWSRTGKEGRLAFRRQTAGGDNCSSSQAVTTRN